MTTMPTSPIQVFPLSDNSSLASFDFTSSIPVHYESDESEDDHRQFSGIRLSDGTSKPVASQSSHTFGKRRYTFSGQDHKIMLRKRRRLTSVAMPQKFLLGGSSTDPLNLNSLESNKQSQTFTSFSPASSPITLPKCQNQVQLIIPPNINDPLNLSAGEEKKIPSLTAKSKKRRRHRRGKRDEDNVEDMGQISPFEELIPVNISLASDISSVGLNNEIILTKFEKGSITVEPEHTKTKASSKTDKKVSNIPIQGSSLKCTKKTFSHSVLQNKGDKILQISKPRFLKSTSKVNLAKFQKDTKKFCYGNHATGKHHWDNFSGEDIRLGLFNRKYFNGKDVLDIGCNTGQITLYIAMHWLPHKIIGIDIDKKLITQAKKELSLHYNKNMESNFDFPELLSSMYGPLCKVEAPKSKLSGFPNNVSFLQANYVPVSEEYLESQKPEYDTILCLRVTKWIQLNFGDDGLKMAFKRMFAQLRNGGLLILEPQPWCTYSASKKITPSIHKTYQSLKMRPEFFCDHLLSNEVGFSSCRLIGRSFHNKKGYRQDIYVFTKGYSTAVEQNLLSTIPYSYDSWTWNEVNDPYFMQSTNETQVHDDLVKDFHTENIKPATQSRNEDYHDSLHSNDIEPGIEDSTNNADNFHTEDSKKVMEESDVLPSDSCEAKLT